MSHKDNNSTTLSIDDQLAMYQSMLTIRRFEETIRRLHLAGKAPGLLHLCTGQEAVATGVCYALNKDDYIASHHRGHGHCIAKGGSLTRLFAELMGRYTGYGKGRSSSMHIYDPENGNLGTNAIVGGSVPLATGAALSAKLRGSRQVAVSFFGDGVLNQGILFESMNMAAIWSLPVLFVCENNGYGEFTESSTVTAGDFKDRGKMFGIHSQEVNGMDVVAVFKASQDGVQRARNGEGPTFLLCETYRYSGHHISDKQDYKKDAEQVAWESRDPILKLRQHLAEVGDMTADQLLALEDDIVRIVSEAEKAAMSEAEANSENLMENIYAG